MQIAKIKEDLRDKILIKFNICFLNDTNYFLYSRLIKGKLINAKR